MERTTKFVDQPALRTPRHLDEAVRRVIGMRWLAQPVALSLTRRDVGDRCAMEVFHVIAAVLQTSYRHGCSREDDLGGLSVVEERNIGCLLVEEHGRLCGMLTDRDIALRVSGRGKDSQLTHVAMVMTPNPVRISVNSTLHELTMLMHSQHVRRVPIIDESGRAISIVTLDDLLVLLGDEMSDLAKTVSEAFFRKPAEVEAEEYQWWASYS